jgi:Condensation domain
VEGAERPGAQSVGPTFEAPSLLSSERRALVSVLLGERGVGSGSSVVLSPRSSPSGVVALSFAQQRLWFLDQLSPGTAFYNVAAAVPLSYAVVPWALERAVNGVIARHEVLRTTFEDRDGRPVQVIAPSLEISLAVHDLRGVAERERAQRAAALASEEAAGPFDLQHGPLLRVGLIALGETEFTFLLTLHHIVSDGWSMGILFAELSELYTAAVADRPPRLEPLPIQYADFAVWQRRWLAGAELERQLAYWREQLAELPVLALPTDRPRPAVQSFRGAVLPVALPAALTARLNLLAQEHDCTLFMLLLAAFQALLARYTGQDDIVVGTYHAGRTRVETEPLIGFFINTLVLRTDLSGDPSFRELLTRTREVALGAYAHQDMSFPKLVEELQPERDLSRNPLFQVVLHLYNAPGAGSTANTSAPDYGPKPAGAVFDLILTLVESADGLRGWLEYNTDLFDSDTVRRMVAHYHMLLQGAADDPDRRLHELPLLTAVERRRLLSEWTATSRPDPDDQGIVSLLAHQVELRADDIAFFAEEAELT